MKLFMKLIGYAIAIPAIVILIVLFAQPEESADEQQALSDNAPEPLEIIQVAEAAVPEHYYAVKDGFYYAYEVVGQTELVRIRYLGEYGGLHKILMVEGSQSATVMACAANCDYAKAWQFWGREFIDETLHKMTIGTVLWEVFQDAWNGELDRYRNHDGKYLDVDRDGRRWIDP